MIAFQIYPESRWIRHSAFALIIIVTAAMGCVSRPVSKVSRPFLEVFDFRITPGHDLIAPGRQFALNTLFGNPVDAYVFDAIAYQAVFVENADNTSDRIVRESFERIVAPIERSYLAGTIHGQSMLGLNDGIWGTKGTPPLTEEQCHGIISGTVRIYFVSWFAWADSNNPESRKESGSDCRWLQPPDGERYTSSSLTWHLCQ